MPELTSQQDLLADDGSAEAVPNGSFEARLGLMARITVDARHDEFALSHYVCDWTQSMEGRSQLVLGVLSTLRASLSKVDHVQEWIAFRLADAREIAVLALPRDVPVMVTEHIGLAGGETIIVATTVRDCRCPIAIC